MVVTQKTPLPLSIIQSAMEGDNDALAAVQNHYRRYICALSKRCIRDAYRNERYYVDEDVRHQLENKLLWSIMTGFRILPE